MAEVMHQGEIGVRIRSSLCPRDEMVGLEFFAIEEALSTHRAPVLLSRGDDAVCWALVPAPGAGAFRPIGLQRWIIRRGGAAYDHMPFDLEPLKLEEVRRRPLCSQRPIGPTGEGGVAPNSGLAARRWAYAGCVRLTQRTALRNIQLSRALKTLEAMAMRK